MRMRSSTPPRTLPTIMGVVLELSSSSSFGRVVVVGISPTDIEELGEVGVGSPEGIAEDSGPADRGSRV